MVGEEAALNARETILETVMRIPLGRVATYGQVARAAGLPGRARLVGHSLKGLGPDSFVPWHRVVGSGGKISIPSEGAADLQRDLLVAEGVQFRGARVDLERHAWSEGGPE
jgi:methylated-DNA-protein-cysteine methyltransferase-like protein